MVYVSTSSEYVFLWEDNNSLEKKVPQFRAKAHSSCGPRQTEQLSRKETTDVEGYHHKELGTV